MTREPHFSIEKKCELNNACGSMPMPTSATQESNLVPSMCGAHLHHHAKHWGHVQVEVSRLVEAPEALSHRFLTPSSPLSFVLARDVWSHFPWCRERWSAPGPGRIPPKDLDPCCWMMGHNHHRSELMADDGSNLQQQRASALFCPWNYM